MSTPKQIAASRANGAKSIGPVTLQGKIASYRNSTRHGLFAENIVLEAEDTGRFIELVESLFEEHNPGTAAQRLLVENIAAARWRQWRIWGMQKVAFDDEVASPSTTNDPLRAVLAWRNSADSMRTHELLLRYEIALDRQISRSLVRLQQLQERGISRNGQPLPVQESIAPHQPDAIPSKQSPEESVQEKTTTAKRTQQPAENITPRLSSGPAKPPASTPNPPFQPARAETSPTQRSRPGAQNRS